MDKKKSTILTIMLLVALVLVTVGISYAFFTYVGMGSRENTIKTGNLTFVYDEQNKQGNGISLTNAFPISDTEGKALVGNDNVFDFQVLATASGSAISYEVIGEKKESSTLADNMVKVYLTSLSGNQETEIITTLKNGVVTTYDELENTTIKDQTGKTLYQEIIPEGQINYNKHFRLRMWVSENATTNTDGEWEYSNQEFSIGVNVVANIDISIPPFISISKTDENIVTISKSGYAPLGIKHYEYYITADEAEEPDYTTVATGVTDGDITLGEYNILNVYYRTVGNNDRKSLWSNKLVAVKTGTSWVYDYTGAEETFTPPTEGNYRLEVWGSQGGSYSSFIGGYGGYSVGELYLQNEPLYINVGEGGIGGTNGIYSQTYNGGGYSINNYTAAYERFTSSGGGATHIATVSGELYTLEEYKDTTKILIVAGGGGGAYKAIAWNTCERNGYSGGNAGGYISNVGKYQGQNNNISYNATQTIGYAFGLGGTWDETAIISSGGGGGWYGGYLHGMCAGGGGGSSYIANPLLTNKTMYCHSCSQSSEVSTKTVSTTCVSTTPIENCAKAGNGSAKITYLGK